MRKSFYVIVSLFALQSVLFAEDAFCFFCEENSYCSKVSFFGDFLYWQSTVNGVPYAITGNEQPIGNPPVSTFFTNDKTHEIHFSYDPGFRIGLRYSLDSAWKLEANWMQFNQSGNHYLRASDDTLINETFYFLSYDILNLKAVQSIHFSQVTGKLTKQIFLGTRFGANGSIGATGAWINQKWKIKSDGLFSTGIGDVDVSHTTKLKNRFVGAGLWGGIGMEMTLSCMFSLYGSASLSLLYGSFDVSQNETQTVNDPDIGTLVKKGKFQPNAVVSSWDIEAGIKGSYRLKKIELFAHLGYEFSLWPDQVRIFRILNNTDGTSSPMLGIGNVGFQGLTVGLGVAY